MEVKPVLALPAGLEVTTLEVSDDVLTITAVSTQVHPACPLCGMSAVRVHSHYTRQVADLPCGGQQVRLLLHMRKSFCEVLTCARKVFVERLTPFVEPGARVTQRLVSNGADHWSGDWGQAWSSCDGSPGDTDLAPDDAPAHYGAANRSSGSGHRARH